MPATKVERQRWYAKDRGNQIRRVSERRTMLSAWITELKVSQGCLDCSESHPACLEFHHLDPSVKEIHIADAIRKGWGKDRILKEIEKCVVICANCHRKRHFDLKV